MKISINIKGDLSKAVQEVAETCEISFHDTVLMLCENGLIKFTETMAVLKKKEDRKNKWYRRIWKRKEKLIIH